MGLLKQHFSSEHLRYLKLYISKEIKMTFIVNQNKAVSKMTA